MINEGNEVDHLAELDDPDDWPAAARSEIERLRQRLAAAPPAPLPVITDEVIGMTKTIESGIGLRGISLLGLATAAYHAGWRDAKAQAPRCTARRAVMEGPSQRQTGSWWCVLPQGHHGNHYENGTEWSNEGSEAS